jgi:uncharacterized protein (TIGR00369 family)
MSLVPEGAVEATRSRALQIFASMRAHDTRFYREYLAIQSSPPHDGACEAEMSVGIHTQGAGGFVAAGAVATLADVATAAAVATLAEQPSRTATVGLTLQLVRELPTQSVHARAKVVSMAGQMGMAQCRLEADDDELLAFATATFAIRPMPDDGSWLPHDRDGAIAAQPSPPADPRDLNGQEQWLLNHVEESLREDGWGGPYASFLGIDWHSKGTGEASGTWPLGPHLWNRVAHLHGGATFGALATAALAAVPDGQTTRIVEQHVQFVRPGQGNQLHVRANVVRRGERLTSVQAALTDDGGLVIASALATLEGVAGVPSLDLEGGNGYVS